MIEKFRAFTDNGLVDEAILTDLPKTFDCINHGLLITKLAAHGFSYFLKLI